MGSSLRSVSAAFHWICTSTFMCCTGKPRTRQSIQMRPQELPGNSNFPSPPGYALAKMAQQTVAPILQPGTSGKHRISLPPPHITRPLPGPNSSKNRCQISVLTCFYPATSRLCNATARNQAQLLLLSFNPV